MEYLLHVIISISIGISQDAGKSQSIQSSDHEIDDAEMVPHGQRAEMRTLPLPTTASLLCWHHLATTSLRARARARVSPLHDQRYLCSSLHAGGGGSGWMYQPA
eukprot:SAG25_NODE_2977_length_1285_cov_0.913997_1_plen_104_part_00